MELWSKNLDFSAIGKQFGTPIYIFNPYQLKENVQSYLRLVERAKNIAYPVKANPSLAVLYELTALGCGADCASKAEVDLAQKAGIPLERIIYNTPCPELDLAVFLLQNKAKVVIDSLEFFVQLAASIEAKKITGDLLIRINPSFDLSCQTEAEIHKVLAHGSSHAKFGIAIEDLLALDQLPLKIQGLHLHIGSRMSNLDNYVLALNYLHELTQSLHEKGQQIKIINIGGGLGIPLHENAVFPEIDSFAARLRPLFKEKIEYIVEPGNSLVGNTMGLLTQIKFIKEIRKKRWAIIDVGTDQLINQIALRTPHQILTEAHEPLAFSGPDSLGGPLCFAGDIILEQTDLNKLKAGDFLFIQHTGAYCYALSNHFNGRYFQGMLRLEADNRLNWAHLPEKPYLDSNHSTYCGSAANRSD